MDRDVSKHVEEFSRKMQFSGYGESFREHVVRSALSAFDKIAEKDERGEVSLHRHKSGEEKRKLSKGAEKNEPERFVCQTH